jgi:hypothetical protein
MRTSTVNSGALKKIEKTTFSPNYSGYWNGTVIDEMKVGNERVLIRRK